jgi:cytochrome c oxidase assembly factor CtaG
MTARGRVPLQASALAVLACAGCTSAHAHGTAAEHATEAVGWAARASGEAPLTAVLALTGVAYAIGAWRLRKRARSSRPRLQREAALFGSGWLVLAGSLLSPLHEAGARSFTLHMVEHELLMLVAAPLLAWSRPLVTMLWSLPSGARRTLGALVRSAPVAGLWGALRTPATATLLQALALWAWHVPFLFELALANEGWHYAQHASFLFTALLFWWSIARATGSRRGYGVGAFCLFVTSLVGGALGALMALSTSPWYEGYARLGMAPFGLTPTEDQQLAGLLMWVPGGLFHLVAALWLVGSWLRLGTPARRGDPDAPSHSAAPAPPHVPRGEVA